MSMELMEAGKLVGVGSVDKELDREVVSLYWGMGPGGVRVVEALMGGGYRSVEEAALSVGVELDEAQKGMVRRVVEILLEDAARVVRVRLTMMILRALEVKHEGLYSVMERVRQGVATEVIDRVVGRAWGRGSGEAPEVELVKKIVVEYENARWREGSGESGTSA